MTFRCVRLLSLISCQELGTSNNVPGDRISMWFFAKLSVTVVPCDNAVQLLRLRPDWL